MHVRGIEVVLFVPGRRRQYDVGIDAGGGHAEIERHQQVELAFRRLVVPRDLAAGFRGLLRRDPCPARRCVVPSRCLRKYSCPLPDEPSRLERQTNRLRGQFAGSSGSWQDKLQLARAQSPARHTPSAPARPPWRAAAMVSGFCLQLRRRGQPAHALGAHVVVDQRCRSNRRRAPWARGSPRRRASRNATGRCGHRRRRCAFMLPRRAGPVERRRRAASSRSAGAAFPGRHSATSRRPIGRCSRRTPAC